MALKILFKYTSRSRRDNFFRGMDSIVNNLSNKEDYHILVSLDVDDAVMRNEEVLEKIKSYKNTNVYYGISYSKIDAINRDLPLAKDFDILVNFSDDQVFTQFGFDDIIRQQMLDSFPDTDGFLHFHDGNQNRLATMSIVGKKYFDRTNYIYHPDYQSVYCDNEEQEKAKILGKYKYAGDSMKIMMHIHPAMGHGKHLLDEQYIRTESFYPVDKETYHRRMAINFGL